MQLILSSIGLPENSRFPCSSLVEAICISSLQKLSGAGWITCAHVLSGGSANWSEEDMGRGLLTSAARFVQELCKSRFFHHSVRMEVLIPSVMWVSCNENSAVILFYILFNYKILLIQASDSIISLEQNNAEYMCVQSFMGSQLLAWLLKGNSTHWVNQVVLDSEHQWHFEVTVKLYGTHACKIIC